MTAEPDRSNDAERSPRPLTRLRAGREPGDDLPSAVAIVAVGTLVPLLAVPVLVPERYAAHLALYLSPGQYVAIAAFGFGLASWALVEGFEIDRVTFAGSAILTPWALTIVLVIFLPALPVDWFDQQFAIVRSTDDPFQYSFAMGAAGIAVVGCSLFSEQLSIRHERSPDRRAVAFATCATECSASVPSPALGTRGLPRRPSTPSPSTPTSRTSRIFSSRSRPRRRGSTSRSPLRTKRSGGVGSGEFDLEHRHGPVRVPIPLADDSRRDGRFAVALVSAWGRTVDSTRVALENGTIVEE